jgi:hypothetical protein
VKNFFQNHEYGRKKMIINKTKLAAVIFGAVIVSFVCMNSTANYVYSQEYYSFESFNYPQHYIRHASSLGEITTISSTLDRMDATFRLVPGLANSSHISFESINYPGYYLRHQDSRIKLHKNDNSDRFKYDATFKKVPGLADSNRISFEASYMPNYFIRHSHYHLYIAKPGGDINLFNKDATFKMTPPLYEVSRTWADNEKVQLLRKYAPRVWFHSDEEYMPSTVEWAFPYLKRIKRDDGNYWLETKQQLSSPSDHSLPLFKGNLGGAKAYAFWVQHHRVNFVDLVYFFYYPYNRGKEFLDTIWGNHVSDWEHITIRLYIEDGTLEPYEVHLSQHSGGQNLKWQDIEKTTDGHPVIYAAVGSHANYANVGGHHYENIRDPLFGWIVLAELWDYTNDGSCRDFKEHLEMYDYVNRHGLGGSAWPLWMSVNYSDPGQGDPSVPGNGPIYRWGNYEWDCHMGQCRLEHGPTGPIAKDGVWDPNRFE